MTQVGVDRADDVGARGGESFEHSGAKSEFAPTMDDAQRARGRERLRPFAGAVGRVVVDDDYFDRDMSIARREQLIDKRRDPIALVVGRYDHGERRAPGVADEHPAILLHSLRLIAGLT